MRDPVENRWESQEGLPSYFDQQPPVQLVPVEWAWPQWAARAPAAGAAVHRPPAHPAPTHPPLVYGPHHEPVTFLRAFDLPYEASAPALHSWWRQEARGGGLDVGRSRLRGPPDWQPGRCHLEVDLHRGFPWRALAMDLELVRWYQTFGTIVGLSPRSRVRPGQVYFGSGNALIDGVIAAVSRHAANLS